MGNPEIVMSITVSGVALGGNLWIYEKTELPTEALLSGIACTLHVHCMHTACTPHDLFFSLGAEPLSYSGPVSIPASNSEAVPLGMSNSPVINKKNPDS